MQSIVLIFMTPNNRADYIIKIHIWNSLLELEPIKDFIQFVSKQINTEFKKNFLCIYIYQQSSVLKKNLNCKYHLVFFFKWKLLQDIYYNWVINHYQWKYSTTNHAGCFYDISTYWSISIITTKQILWYCISVVIIILY